VSLREGERLPEWLRPVPPGWDVPLLRLVARVESGHTPSRSRPDYWVPEECDIPWFTLADIWQLREGRQKYLGDTREKVSRAGIAASSARLLPSGTVVLSRTASVGFSGIMAKPMATSQDFVNFVCGPRLSPDFLLWALRGMRPELDRLRRGSTHQTIYMPDVLQFRVPLPPKSMQRAIAGFLDWKTTAIDALIQKKERLLQLLDEKRAALIHRVVTKGLDPSAPMKDSGLPWVGEIPAHWEVKRLKFILQTIEQGWSPECEQRLAGDGEWGVLKAGCVNFGRFRSDEHKTLPEEIFPKLEYEVRCGDVLMSRANTKELVGSVAMVERTHHRLLLCDKLYRLRFSSSVDPLFFVLVLNGPMVRAQHEAKSSGASSSMQNISQELVKELAVVVPPKDEQTELALSLVTMLERLSRAKGDLRRSVARLREYRQALITAAVTGQLAIPEVAA